MESQNQKSPFAFQVRTAEGVREGEMPKRREPSEAEKRLKLALHIAALHHTYSMAQRLGIYPA